MEERHHDPKGWHLRVQPWVPTEKEIASWLDKGYEVEVKGLSLGVLVMTRKRTSI